MSLEKIKKQTLRQNVYEQIKDSIINAELLPGQTISLKSIAEHLGVSQMPVREALWQLQTERIVLIDSNKSIRVNQLTQEEFDEVLTIRSILEPMAGRLACDLRAEHEVTELSAMVDSMRKTLFISEKYFKVNKQFHFTIYNISKSPILLQLIDLLWGRIGPYFNIYSLDEEDLRANSMACHTKMFEALRDQDKDLMESALLADFNSAGNRIRPQLATQTVKK